MKTALVVGGTGLTGKQLTYLLLADKRHSKVILLVREPLDTIHAKLEQVRFDFDDPDASVPQADDVFCCLGTTIKKAGSKEAFRKVDYEYVLKTAQASHANGAKNFMLVSAAGAGRDSSFFYSRVKGEIEEAVGKVGYTGLHIFRPSVLLGNRKETRLGESITIALMKMFLFLIPKKYKPVHANKVAKLMVDAANSGKQGKFVYESDVINEVHL